jgi:hypothetical protein
MSAPRVLHAIPGRVRVRLPDDVDGPALAARAREQPGIVEAHWSPLTRGLLVRYDPASTSPEALLAAAAPTRRTAPAGSARSAAVAPPPAGSPSARVAAAIRHAVSQLDAGVARSTAGMLDLGLVLALGLFGWAIRELVRGQVAPLAWSSALWYAHGLFRDYHGPAPRH